MTLILSFLAGLVVGFIGTSILIIWDLNRSIMRK